MAKESSASRRARVKFQLRDKKGRWIEMGRGVKWYSPQLKRNVSGTVMGVSGRNAVVNLTSEPKGADGKPQQVTVKGSDIEVISSKATLGGRAGKMAKVATKSAKKAELVGGREDKGDTITAEKPTDDSVNKLIKSSEEALEKAEKPKTTAKPKDGGAKAKADAKKGSQADSDKEDEEVPEIDEPDVADLEEVDVDEDLGEDEADADEDVDTSPTSVDDLEATIEELEAVVEEVASGDLDANEIDAKLEEEVYSVFGKDGKQYDLDVKKDLEGNWNYRLRDAAGKARKIHAMIPADENDSVDAGAKLNAAMNPKKAKATTAKPEEKAPEAKAVPAPEAPAPAKVTISAPARRPAAIQPKLDIKGIKNVKRNGRGDYESSDMSEALMERLPVGTEISSDETKQLFIKVAPNRWAEPDGEWAARELKDVDLFGEGDDTIYLPGGDSNTTDAAEIERLTAVLDKNAEESQARDREYEESVKAREEAKKQADPVEDAPAETEAPESKTAKASKDAAAMLKWRMEMRSEDARGMKIDADNNVTVTDPARAEEIFNETLGDTQGVSNRLDINGAQDTETQDELLSLREKLGVPDTRKGAARFTPARREEPKAADPKDMTRDELIDAAGDLDGLKHEADITGMGDRQFTPDHQARLDALNKELKTRGDESAPQPEGQKADTTPEATPEVPQNAPEAADTPEEQKADTAPENATEAAPAATAQTDEEADAAIAALMAEQGIERTEPTTMGGEKYPPTRQQQDVIDAVMAGKNTKVQAMAGTGKTSTLEALSRRLQVTGKQAVYIAFNKTVQTEAAERMPGNVEARTGHSLANAWASKAMPFLGMRMANKDPLKTFVNPKTKKTEPMPKVPITASDKIARVLGIGEKSVTIEGGQGLGKTRSVQAVKRMVNSYALSDSDEVGPEHIPAEFSADDAEFVLSEEGKTALVGFAKAYWDDLSREDGVFRVAHDTYRKHWALSRPDLTDGSGGNKGADVLYIDEAQDTPAVLAKVVADQNMQKVIVGDANQAIYAFAENIDYLSEADSDIELPLNKSWRFGPVVADAGNRFLELLEAPNRVVGGGGESKRVVGMEDADAVLVRTNAGMVDAVLEEAENGRRVSAPDGTRDNLKSLATSVQSLMNGERPEKPHDDLVGYKNWDEVLTAFYQKDPSVQTLTKLFDVTDAKQLSKMTPDQHEAARENAMARVNKAIDAIVERVDGFDTIQKKVEGKRTYLEVADDFEGTANQRDFAVLNFAANLGRKKDPYAADASDSWTVKNKAYRAAGLGILKADGWRFDGNSMRWYSENADTVAKFDAFEGEYDVMVSTAHKSKGLEWDRVRIGYDFPAPRQDENTGATVMPEDAEYKLAYVAATRAKKELDMGGLDYVYEMTSENGGLPKARKGDSDESDAARVEDGAVTPEAAPEPEDNTDIIASEAEATRYDDSVPAEVADSAAPEAPQAPEAEVADESAPEAAPEASEASPEPVEAPEPTPAPAAAPEPVEVPEGPNSGPEGEAPPEPTVGGQEDNAREIGENFVPGDADETQAAMLYMAGAEYNNVLRQGNTENDTLNTRIESLTGFIEKQKPLPIGTKVYRGGAKGVGEYKVGEEFSDPAFLSTSLNRDQSDLMSGGGALMEIDANGLKGLSITSVLEHESYKDVPDDLRPALNPLNREAEILMPPGTKLQIDAIDTDESGRTIVRASAAPAPVGEAPVAAEASEVPDDAEPVTGLDDDGLTPAEAAYVQKLEKAISDGYRTGIGNIQALQERLDEMYERGAARQRGEDPDAVPEAAPEVKPVEDREPATPEAEEEVVPEAEEVVEEAPEPTPEAPVEVEPVGIVETPAEEGSQGDVSDGEEEVEGGPTDLESFEATASELFETFQDTQTTPRTPAELQDILDEEVYLLVGEDGADYEFGLSIDDKGSWNYVLSDDDGNELERYNVVTTSPEEAGQKAFERVNGSQESETAEAVETEVEAPADEVITPEAVEEPVADADRIELDPADVVVDTETVPEPTPMPVVEDTTAPEEQTPVETPEVETPEVSEEGTAPAEPESAPVSSVVAKAGNYPDGTQIKDSRTSEVIQKTNGKWHVAGKPSKPADPAAANTPVVSEMPKQPAESFAPFEGIDSVTAGDIVITKNGAQAAVIGVRDGKLVVMPHNVPNDQKALRPNTVFADPAAITGINKFDASDVNAPATEVAPAASKPKESAYTGNRGRTDLTIMDGNGYETKIGDTVMTAIGQGEVVSVRPSSGPQGSVQVRLANGDVKMFRSNKFTNAAGAESIVGDDPATMEVGAQGTGSDGRKFLVGKGNKPIHKGDRVELADGRVGTVSGIYAGVKSANIKMEDGATLRKKVSTLDATDFGTIKSEILEPKSEVRDDPRGYTGNINLADALSQSGGGFSSLSEEDKGKLEEGVTALAARISDKMPDGMSARVYNLLDDRAVNWDGDDWATFGIHIMRDGQPVGMMMRRFAVEGDGSVRAYHDNFNLTPKEQGRGVGRAVTEETEAFYRSLGIESIHLKANIDVGGFAWARAGYNFADAEAMVDLVDDLKERFKSSSWLDHTPEEYTIFVEFIKRATKENWDNGTYPTPFEFAQLGYDGSENWLGKRMMLHANWNGVKNLG